MAHILEFRSSALRAEAECAVIAPQGSAQIIIFPGVRIERHAEPELHEHRPRRRDRGRTKRDRLELPD